MPLQGRKQIMSVADIPAEAETIEFGKDIRSVLVFRDRNTMQGSYSGLTRTHCFANWLAKAQNP